MDKKIIAAFVVGIVIGAIGGSMAVSSFKKDRYQHFTSSSFPQGGRINTETGETWLLLAPMGGSLTWVKVPESK
jgi:hypothetical protein